MKLEGFIKVMEKEIEEFRAYWMKMRAKEGAKDWPLVMGEGDWWEQYQAYLSNQGHIT